MYKLVVKSQFSAAHFLRDYEGSCEKLHGHNWKVELTVKGKKLNSIGLLLDFKVLKKILSEVLKELDHRLINDHPEFLEKNPSSEHLAEFIFNKVKERLKEFENVEVCQVAVYETENSCAIYSED
ncbi:MAG: 6-carboxytetrahydropterin synthase QueD [Thermodesulfobacteria bacterium]|nr:6-carboxytetrahydropterin synthase QueD [Thermodesulfobacteriota bacterium]